MIAIFFKRLCYLTSLLLLSGLLLAATDDLSVINQESEGSPPAIGNFALPSPQQPGPLMAFGQTLIGRNYLQFSLETFSPYHVGGAFDSVNASLIYGISDNTALYFSYPLQDDVQTRTHRRTGLLDATLQLEHAFYSAGNTHYQEQATWVGAVTLPINEASTHVIKTRDRRRREILRRGGTKEEIISTVITKSTTNLEYGAPTFFGGATYNRTYVDWMGFVSPGFLLTTTSDHIRLGSQVFYQAGIGRNIYSITDQSILFGMLEFDGQYTAKDHIYEHYNPNSGGNVIALTPSIWFSMKSFIAQVGVGFPVLQNLNGNQTKMDYFIAANFSWTIK